MNISSFSQRNNNSGISANVTGLSSALLEHCLALASLAALETRQFLKQTLSCLLLFVAVILLLFMGYLTLLATCLVAAVYYFHIGWPYAFGIATLFHFLSAGILIAIISRQQSHAPLPLTRFEIQRDIEALRTSS
ncbi:MAG: hypothetical protein A3F67_02655 [Verrucomicrobia bacterium RIFCSPHIGHO2_12_FULL_41_10]|nr:MAG: hypothetical protein A3F67_02655 [Verrucomicrobia bacterium RIFCSPHIGHO2_12_FULL_41_10]HLB34902.1 phage holin family protein [Chthoniobacterales bacterium]